MDVNGDVSSSEVCHEEIVSHKKGVSRSSLQILDDGEYSSQQMLTDAQDPSSKERITANVVSTQFGDCNLASKNMSVPTEVEIGITTDPEVEKQMPSQ